MEYELAGPDGFFRNTFVVQETVDTWPVVYVWKGQSESSEAVLRRWVFKRDMCEEQTPWWEDSTDGNRGLFTLTYAQWWAFVYFMATNYEKFEDGTVALEERFYREVIVPGLQTEEEGEQK